MNFRQLQTATILFSLILASPGIAQQHGKKLILRSDFPAKTVMVSNINQQMGERTPYLVAATVKDNGTPKEFRSLLQFNYDYLPATIMTDPSKIASAELVLYPANAGFLANDPNAQEKLIVKRITENWFDSATAWDNQPNVDTSTVATLKVKIKKKTPEIRINVTLLVMDMILHGNKGFMICQNNTTVTDSIAGLSFASSLNEDKLRRPLLIITYSDDSYSTPDGQQRRPVSAPIYQPPPRSGGTGNSNRSE